MKGLTPTPLGSLLLMTAQAVGILALLFVGVLSMSAVIP